MRKAIKGKAKGGKAMAPANGTRKLSEVEETLLKAVAERITSRGSAPGILLSWLKDKKVFYGSVQRFNGGYGQGKEVVFSKQAPTIVELIQQLGMELVRESELDHLKRVL